MILNDQAFQLEHIIVDDIPAISQRTRIYVYTTYMHMLCLLKFWSSAKAANDHQKDFSRAQLS